MCSAVFLCFSTWASERKQSVCTYPIKMMLTEFANQHINWCIDVVWKLLGSDEFFEFVSFFRRRLRQSLPTRLRCLRFVKWCTGGSTPLRPSPGMFSPDSLNLSFPWKERNLVQYEKTQKLKGNGWQNRWLMFHHVVSRDAFTISATSRDKDDDVWLPSSANPSKAAGSFSRLKPVKTVTDETSRLTLPVGKKKVSPVKILLLGSFYYYYYLFFSRR